MMAMLKVWLAIAAMVLGWSAVRAEPQAVRALLTGHPISAGQAIP